MESHTRAHNDYVFRVSTADLVHTSVALQERCLSSITSKFTILNGVVSHSKSSIRMQFRLSMQNS